MVDACVPMLDPDFRNRLVSILAKQLNVSPESLKDSQFVEDLVADSLDLAELVMELEEDLDSE